MDPGNLKWSPLVQSWLNQLSYVQEDLKDFIFELFNRTVDRVLSHIEKHCDQSIHQVRTILCRNNNP